MSTPRFEAHEIARREPESMPYGLHIVPTNDGRFKLLLGRDEENCAANYVVSQAMLGEIAALADKLFSKRYGHPTSAAANFLYVYSTMRGPKQPEPKRRGLMRFAR